MTSLDLNANLIGDDDAKAITPSRSISTQAFKVNTVVTTLDLNANSIGDERWCKGHYPLRVNTGLTDLNLFLRQLNSRQCQFNWC